MVSYLSIVIPIYNEEANITNLWARLSKVLKENWPGQEKTWEVVFTDDGSRDRSLDMLLAIAAEEPRVTVVEFNRNYGQHSAIFGAFAVVRGEVVVTMDADLQNPPEEIPKLVAKIEEGFDVVGGWRQGRTHNDSFFRTMPSKIVNAVTRRTTGVRLHDYGCMLRAYRREVVDAMLLCKERSSFIPALANSFAKRIAEVPVGHAERAAGDSKYGLWKLINLQFDLLTSFSLLPLQMLSVLGVIISLLGIGFGVFLMAYRFLHPEGSVGGVFTLFAVLFFFVGAQFLAFGLLGEYIGRIYQEVRDRPRYVVKKHHRSEPGKS
ncbi:glycosyltransferase [Mesoterricola silvestris]|uniref:Undecaprenyl-phosphate 4-deoxy-4-formamido-L-arabinose transferase n=1 Tax=Mesoterricola silvestris TaxID=2927979 RepID=A0AA48GZ95_9BACT|nr:glycosyltransferase [Mesoterricola silvestris]BDU74581.1 undecaprenyl-phosphate 4-deoxy-4-formamido-L-arabinose transferase [Mesoterricola silvestris]